MVRCVSVMLFRSLRTRINKFVARNGMNDASGIGIVDNMYTSLLFFFPSSLSLSPLISTHRLSSAIFPQCTTTTTLSSTHASTKTQQRPQCKPFQSQRHNHRMKSRPAMPSPVQSSPVQSSPAQRTRNATSKALQRILPQPNHPISQPHPAPLSKAKREKAKRRTDPSLTCLGKEKKQRHGNSHPQFSGSYLTSQGSGFEPRENIVSFTHAPDRAPTSGKHAKEKNKSRPAAIKFSFTRYRGTGSSASLFLFLSRRKSKQPQAFLRSSIPTHTSVPRPCYGIVANSSSSRQASKQAGCKYATGHP
ncbi:uncharacterized protein LY89DRAFT_325395 [Mollisia scopiformis]|uniref:Uncharacterized protein n=1 Tax=Mollisia scopiformis TaxID=149040 RepID=A0A132B8J3_MOLSC|nr:uncharacterized protein LY89DRAFT_325395 [Mollisia scopiformis]KUJ08730.1 hypothetical protein LY89DRAFT_325395 [Mollisia scopiformis]